MLKSLKIVLMVLVMNGPLQAMEAGPVCSRKKAVYTKKDMVKAAGRSFMSGLVVGAKIPTLPLCIPAQVIQIASAGFTKKERFSKG